MPRNKSRHCCVVCFREYSVNSPTNEVRQPDNPRRVFKVCSSYLKPEVFTKYSKWDLFSDLERQSPFCAMCSKSGEKLSALNDKLEEVQREIKCFLKYFVKEILSYRHAKDNDEIEMTDEENDAEKECRNEVPSSSSIPSGRITTGFQIYKDTNPLENISCTIKKEIPEHGYSISEDEYFPVSDEDEEGDDRYVPRKSIKRSKSEANSSQHQEGDPKSESPKNSMKKPKYSIIPWREIQISPEEVEEKWSLMHSGNPRSKWLKTAYFYCKLGGKRCPVRLKKKEATGKLGFHFYDNSRQHVHIKKSFGVPKSIEREVQNIYEGNPESAKPAFIMEALEAQGMKIRKKQLHNLMTKLRRMRMERLGLLPPKEERKKNSNQLLSGPKRKRGRPPTNKSTHELPTNSIPAGSGNDRGQTSEPLISEPFQISSNRNPPEISQTVIKENINRKQL